MQSSARSLFAVALAAGANTSSLYLCSDCFSSDIIYTSFPYTLSSACISAGVNTSLYSFSVCVFQLVFISVGVSRPQRRSADAAAGSDGAPTRDSSPMLLLLEEKHFSQLLQLMNQLSSLRAPVSRPDTALGGCGLTCCCGRPVCDSD